MFENGIIFDISKDLYYVKTENGNYMSKARGVFRKQKFSPIVGDNVKIEIFEDNTAYIVEVFERKNEILKTFCEEILYNKIYYEETGERGIVICGQS